MSKISTLLAHTSEPFVSFEFFPPKTDEGVANLLPRIARYQEQGPLFLDMTWGAGGSTSDLTLSLCQRIKTEIKGNPNMHLTCTNMPKEKIDIALRGAQEHGIVNILALRGDPPLGQEWSAIEGGFTCARDLVSHITLNYPNTFCVSVAGYPEGHVAAIKPVPEGYVLTDTERSRLVTLPDGEYVCRDEDYAQEMLYLKSKVDAGAHVIITQMIFDASVYTRFVADCRAIGIQVPIIPGVMCIQNAAGFDKMTRFCKSRVPEDVRKRIDEAKDDKKRMFEVSVEEGARLCKALLAAGAPGIHFYTLNLEKVTLGILNAIGMNKVPYTPDNSDN